MPSKTAVRCSLIFPDYESVMIFDFVTGGVEESVQLIQTTLSTLFL